VVLVRSVTALTIRLLTTVILGSDLYFGILRTHDLQELRGPREVNFSEAKALAAIYIYVCVQKKKYSLSMRCSSIK
jgi:hypothetical protein